METIHPPNATEWQRGDHVIHDSVAKCADMLMVVFGRSAGGVYRTRYAFPAEQQRSWRRKVWRNMLSLLHNPRRFGIVIPAQAIRQETRASIGPPPTSSTPARGPIAKS